LCRMNTVVNYSKTKRISYISYWIKWNYIHFGG
jgi:hypothetical protein